MNKFGLLIGRFNPIHQGHIKLIKFALKQIKEKLIVIIGSSNTSRTQKNPFNYDERLKLFQLSLKPEFLSRIIFCSQDDFNDNIKWSNAIKTTVSIYCFPYEITLFGYYKDDSSYYLKLFPEYNNSFVNNNFEYGLSSTYIRNEILVIENDVIKLNRNGIQNCCHFNNSVKEYLYLLCDLF